MRVKIWSFLLISLLFSQSAWANDGQLPVSGNPEQLMGFAQHLFDTGEYYRAITEYQRFMFLYSKDAKVPYARFQIGACYFAGEELEDAIKIWQASLKHPMPPELHQHTLYQLGAAYYKLNKYTLCRKYMEQLQQEHPDSSLIQDSYKLLTMSYIQQERWEDAAMSTKKMLTPKSQKLAARVSEGEKLPYKSPGLAGALSAVLPGAGQLYAGRTQDAIMSFMLNGLFIWGAIEAFSHDKTATGIILVFFETGWYLGNIYSASNSAHKYNRNLKQSFRQEIKDNLQFNLGVPQVGPMGLSISYRF